MNNKNLISIIMPTYNSEKTIWMVLDSVKKQTYKHYEILVIDGWSTDSTKIIAEKYWCKIINNPNKLPEYAKHVWLMNANWYYAMTLDSDEVLMSNDALKNRIDFIQTHRWCKNISSSWLINPKTYPHINNYIISYGEPFSRYMYHINGSNYLLDMYRKFTNILDDNKYVIFSFKKNDIPPICDWWWHFFDLNYFKTIIDINDISNASQIFTIMQKYTHQLWFIKWDFIEHYSTPSVAWFLNKVKRRIINNIHYGDTKTVGYSNREELYPWRFRIKKVFFPIYVFLFIWPLYDSILMVIRNRSLFYLNHIYFSYYTVIIILKEIIKKNLWIKTKINIYGK